MKILGIDIGGTTVKGLLINSENKSIIKEVKPFKTELGNDLKWLFNNLNNLGFSQDTYDLLGISIPGFLDHEKGIVISSGNMKINNLDVNKEVSKYINKKVFIINDANAAALGEHWAGAANSFSSFLYYTIGTGVGGALFLNNKLIYGSQSFAGEFGHGGSFTSYDDKISCGCGLKYCMEKGSNAKAYKNELKKIALEKNNSLLANKIKERGEEFDLVDVVDLFHKNDENVIKAFSNASDAIAKHIATLLYAINPSAVIIGGGISGLGDSFSNLIKERTLLYADNIVLKKTIFKTALLKNTAGSFGAAYWAIINNK
ncbi:MAG: ROK family protein [Metamycoplasmataceae bacterium]